MNVKLVSKMEEIEKVCPVLLQLRAQYTIETLAKQIEKQQAQGYQLAYLELEQQVLCVAGFVISEKLAWGKHIYIDDLVTCKNHRNTGAGTFLLQWLKAYAKANDCQQLHLDSGVQRFAAHRFYLREGFNIASHHFSLTER